GRTKPLTARHGKEIPQPFQSTSGVSFSPFSCVGLLSDFFLMGLHLFLSKECFTILNKIELPSQKKRQPHINKVMFQMKRIIFSLLKILRFLLNPHSFLIPGREYVQPLFSTAAH